MVRKQLRKRDPIRTLPIKTTTLTGYARCSTDRQDLAAQRQSLMELGVAEDRIYTDYGLTGPARPGLDQALAAVYQGDTLVVPKLDCLARSVRDAHAIGDQLQERGVNLALGWALYAPADPMGKMFFNTLAAFAKFEADLIRMPPASVPSAISPSSSPSQDQPSIAHSTGSFPLGVRSCPSPESTLVTATSAWARLESRECWRSDCLARG